MSILKKYLSKEASIKELKKVKVVLGNGFDLFCGIKSSYKDFFESQKESFAFYIEDYSKKANTVDDYYSFLDDNDNYASFSDKHNLNVWMAFFALASEKDKEYLWCDIETMMSRSFHESVKGILWERVLKFLNDDFEEIYDIDFQNVYLASLFKYIYTIQDGIDEDSFYDNLLEQLNIFEKLFIAYIKRCHTNLIYSQYGVVTKNVIFTKNSKYVLGFLCNLDDVVSIDTFNFDETDDEIIDYKIRHINGDLDYPIFGVDSNTIQADSPQFIFTKLSRRMNYEMNNQNGFSDEEFENVVIFGHSLSEHDYSYFFPLLDRMNILQFECRNQIVFAYAVYDIDKKPQIIKSYRKAIFDLFTNYAKYKSIKITPERLLDSLTTQNRIIMYQIPVTGVKHDSKENDFGTRKLY